MTALSFTCTEVEFVKFSASLSSPSTCFTRASYAKDVFALHNFGGLAWAFVGSQTWAESKYALFMGPQEIIWISLLRSTYLQVSVLNVCSRKDVLFRVTAVVKSMADVDVENYDRSKLNDRAYRVWASVLPAISAAKLCVIFFNPLERNAARKLMCGF